MYYLYICIYILQAQIYRWEVRANWVQGTRCQIFSVLCRSVYVLILLELGVGVVCSLHVYFQYRNDYDIGHTGSYNFWMMTVTIVSALNFLVVITIFFLSNHLTGKPNLMTLVKECHRVLQRVLHIKESIAPTDYWWICLRQFTISQRLIMPNVWLTYIPLCQKGPYDHHH